MSFADKMLHCERCDRTFIFTVEQQREMAAAGQEVVEPTLCPTCQRLVAPPEPQFQAGSEAGLSPVESASPGDREVPPPPVVGPGRHTGQVKWFDARKGFGFIIQDEGGEIFVHHTGIAGEGYKRLEDGQLVEYEIETTSKGPQAINVTPIEPH
jgi:CspA family cold shock protein